MALWPPHKHLKGLGLREQRKHDIYGWSEAEAEVIHTAAGFLAATGALTKGAFRAIVPSDIDAIAWTPYTPTITASVGAITTVSATGRYQTLGKTMFIEVDILVTTNGTGSGSLLVPLPSGSAKARTVICGRENVTSGLMLQAFIDASGTAFAVFTYANGYPAVDTSRCIISGSLELA